MKSSLGWILRLVLRIFFRRIEVSGLERVPARGPVMFVLNHPNGLIDPAFLVCFAPRRVSFLAKAPLFRMPVIGWLCRRFEAIPVHRRQDTGSDPAQNRETFETARRILQRGGAIAIFPEGTSHDDSRMRPLKTGAARIALGTGEPIRIVPASIYYRAKQTFRSVALLYFGEPFAVNPVSPPVAPGAEPPLEPVRELTRQIQEALAQLVPQAERAEAQELFARAQRIVQVDEDARARPPLAGELELRQRIAHGAVEVRHRWPDRYVALETRIDRYETQLKAAGLDPHHVTPSSYTATRVIRYALQSAIVFLLLLPAALAGLIVHYPAYRIVGTVATGMSKGEEAALASVKVLAAMLLFPVTWGLEAAALWVWVDPVIALVSLLVVPIAGYGSLLFFERGDRLIGRARAIRLLLARRRTFLRLVAERRAIKDQMVALDRQLQPSTGRSVSNSG